LNGTTVTDRVPAPDNIEDLQRTVLPSRALLVTVRDVLSDARRGALADTVRAARRMMKSANVDDDLLGATVLEAMWDAVSCLELAANVAAPWVDPTMEAVHGRWAEMTRYDPSRVNRFYESSHKWSDEQFAALSGHRFDNGQSIVDVLRTAGFENERFTVAFEEAEIATARFLRGRFQYLASSWAGLRGYAAAYEHGLLLAPSEYGEAVDENDQPLSQALIVWATRKDGVHWPDGMSTNDLVAYAETSGGLAVDLADYVADARLRTVESLDFEGDAVFLKPLRNPVPYWVAKGDLSDETMALLDSTTLTWVEGDQGDGGRQA
jgi:hypothetical protein